MVEKLDIMITDKSEINSSIEKASMKGSKCISQKQEN
jgi:hypothetical protein